MFVRGVTGKLNTTSVREGANLATELNLGGVVVLADAAPVALLGKYIEGMIHFAQHVPRSFKETRVNTIIDFIFTRRDN